ncbi:MAG: hypothetical protein HON92_08440 [Planctomycetaceae bacterium]|nr:hypothetical protein [Planctomycetaceae bacterium]
MLPGPVWLRQLAIHLGGIRLALLAGVLIAFIAITVDRLINAWVRKRKAEIWADAI